MKKNYFLFFILSGVAMILLLASCSNKEVVTSCLQGYTYGFWSGLWHGVIAPIDLIFMLFRDDVSVYAENNNGAGMLSVFSSGAAAGDCLEEEA